MRSRSRVSHGPCPIPSATARSEWRARVVWVESDLASRAASSTKAFVGVNENLRRCGPQPVRDVRPHLGDQATLATPVFEKARIVERVHAGLARAKRPGKRLGRPRIALVTEAASGLTVRQAAALWGCSKSTAARRLAAGEAPASIAVA